MEERLQKIMSQRGIASRRKAEDMIREGRVVVNGKVATLGMKADPERDHIKISGKLLKRPDPETYIILNKPCGVLTTFEDEEVRPTVKELIKGVKFRVFPVGRLDFHSEGLLLLTNNGELASKIIHPSHKVPKTYHVKVKGTVADSLLDKLRNGIVLEDGKTAPALVKTLRMHQMESNTWLEVILHEGRKRQIRRMCERVNHPVLKLKRIKIDGITLGDLPSGRWRYLRSDEIEKLKRSVTLMNYT
jgi:23S rRNA pseudouridine2605 synthase